MKLPDAILDLRNFFVGKPGSGKTFAAKSAIENVLDRGWRTCVVDPTGAWWGLRSSKDGRHAGYDITIFGGKHGDLPLTEASAPIIAEAVAHGDFSCIIDLSGMKSQSSRRRFMKAFSETLYEHNDNPLHLVLDEADMWCPQKPMEDVAAVLGARIDEIVRRGRLKGFIPWLITQRPAVIHKDVLSTVDTMVLFTTISSQDRDALDDWIKSNADMAKRNEIRGRLPTLAPGDCVVWCPSIGILKDYRFSVGKTFDSSKTPSRGEKRREPGVWSKPDLEGIKAKMAAVEEEVATNDPKALRSRVAELERQLQLAPSINAETVSIIAAARKEGHDEGFRAGVSYAEKDTRGDLLSAKEQCELAIGAIERAMETRDDLGVAIKYSPPLKSFEATYQYRQIPYTIKMPVIARVLNKQTNDVDKSTLKILESLAFWRSLGQENPSRAMVAAVAGWAPTKGHLKNVVGAARSAGYVDVPAPNRLAATAKGISATPSVDVGRSLRERLSAVLDGSQKRVVDSLWKGGLSRHDLATMCGWDPEKGHLKNVLGSMKSMEIITYPKPGHVALADWVK